MLFVVAKSVYACDEDDDVCPISRSFPYVRVCVCVCVGEHAHRTQGVGVSRSRSYRGWASGLRSGLNVLNVVSHLAYFVSVHLDDRGRRGGKKWKRRVENTFKFSVGI